MANENSGKVVEHLEWRVSSSFIQIQSSESCSWQMTAAFPLKTNLAIWPKRFTTLAVAPVRTIEENYGQVALPDKCFLARIHFSGIGVYRDCPMLRFNCFLAA